MSVIPQLVLFQLATLEEGKPTPLLEVFYCIFLCLSIKKKSLFRNSSGKMYTTGSCNLLKHRLVTPFPRSLLSQNMTSIALSGALLTSAPGTFTFTEIHPPTLRATPGFYLGRLHSTHDVSNSRVPFPDPCSYLSELSPDQLCDHLLHSRLLRPHSFPSPVFKIS